METIERIIIAWKMQYGVKMHRMGLRRCIPIATRYSVLCHLVKTLKENFGYAAENFNEEVMKKIVDACVTETSANYWKADTWRKHVREDLKLALFKHYFAGEKIELAEDKDSMPSEDENQ